MPDTDSVDTRSVGTVAALWRYPVKSMRGEQLETAEVTERGTVGDRAYAVIDVETGKVASAKQPRKWARLLECSATFVEAAVANAPAPAVRITLPDGSEVRSDDAKVDATLSAALDREVTLAATAPADRTLVEYWPDIEGLAPAEFIESTRIADEQQGETLTDVPMGMAAPPGTFYDLALLHVLTTSSLAHLHGLYPEGRFDVRRYRPNILVDPLAAGLVENDWPGQTLGIGADLQIAVSLPTMRCVMTTLAQGDLPRDLGILQTVARHNRLEIPGFGTWACVGAYGDVATPGTVRVGDHVSLIR
ncbi:MAG: uncharacterized protein QOH10_680 [Actinomycetota bacterium]|nr:uncharacterized protein [Actinomycetota bacterium]